jgi:hypothetical protein
MKILFALLCVLAIADARADPRADVQRAFENVLAAGGFRGYAQGHLFGPGLPALTGEVDVLFPDRIHVRTEQMEFIALPDRAWVSALGLWTPTDGALLPVTAFDVAAMRKAIASIRDVHEEGTAKAHQCATHVYRFRSSGQLPGGGGDGDLRVWVCEGTNRPARLEATDTQSTDKLTFDFDWSQRPDVRAPR